MKYTRFHFSRKRGKWRAGFSMKPTAANIILISIGAIFYYTILAMVYIIEAVILIYYYIFKALWKLIKWVYGKIKQVIAKMKAGAVDSRP